MATAGVGSGVEEIADGSTTAGGEQLVNTGTYQVVTKGLNAIESVPTALIGSQEVQDACL